MDLEMFIEFVENFNKEHKTCITKQQCELVFKLLDFDDSGELEEEEVLSVLGVRQTLG